MVKGYMKYDVLRGAEKYTKVHKRKRLLQDMNDYDIIQGKRTYQYFDREVLYPFGYGLTYAAFSYEKMQIKKERGCIKVSCFIKNTGERSADEVVQLYVHKKGSRVQRGDAGNSSAHGGLL